jgi:hypothetical protein
MPLDVRKANWRFDALWAFPAHMVGSTDFANRNKLLDELDSLLKRDAAGGKKWQWQQRNTPQIAMSSD